MRRAVCILLLASAGPASAEPAPSVAVRISAAFGALEELTWSAPEVDLVGTLPVGERGFVAAAVGYSTLDNHTFLSDGEDIRFAVAGGARVLGELRVSAALGLELIAFHSDPDVLALHPDVDQIVHRRGTIPSANIELRYPLGASTAIGVFTRIGLRELTLFETSSGDRAAARLVLAGAFIELPIR
jgi:hypothetical protein